MSIEFGQFGNLCVEDFDTIGVPDKFVELIDGTLVHTLPATFAENRVASNFVFMFREFCTKSSALEYGGSNDGFLLKRNPDTILCPDASLYLRQPEAETMWLEFAPEIAVEVGFSNSRITELALRRQRYFDAGSEQCWMAYIDFTNMPYWPETDSWTIEPPVPQLEIFFRDGRYLKATGDSVIEGEGIVAGLTINLSELFSER